MISMLRRNETIISSEQIKEKYEETVKKLEEGGKL